MATTMKKIIILLSALLVLASCDFNPLRLSGNLVSKDFAIEGTYTQLDVSSAFTVTVCDTVSQVIVTTDEALMPKVEVIKKGEKLIIHLKPEFVSLNRGAKMEALLPYNPDLREVELSGAADLYSSFPLKGQKVEIDLSGASNYYGDIEADKVEMELSGAADFKGNVAATDLDLDLSGASSVTTEGQFETVTIDLSGASKIIKTVADGAYGFRCNRCEGSISGASSAFIHCDGTLRVDLSGASDLHYTGNASTTGTHTSGASNLIHDEL